MVFESIWPFFGCMALLLGLAATPLLAAADTPPSPRRNRIAAVDGLRGFLALAVVFHHVAMYHGFLADGGWRAPASRFYDLLGPVGVSLFFMITGYLFWSRLLREAGRPAWLHLYIGRLFRIGPLYLAAIFVMLLAVFVQTGVRLHVPATQLVAQAGRWLVFGLVTGPDVNGYRGTKLLLAGVTWTLQSEWTFYLSLPVLAFAARRRGMALPAVAMVLAACLVRAAWHPAPAGRVIQAALFLTGMLCASLHERRWTVRLVDRTGSALAVALLGAVFVSQSPYSAGSVLLLGGVFYLVTSGCTVFGLLVSRPARRLGDISYGIYLLQGLLLAVVFRPAVLKAVALGAPLGHWALALLGAVLLVAVATLAHVAIERPGIALGRRVGAAIRAARPAPKQAALRPAVPAPQLR